MSRSAFGSTLVPTQTRRASFKLENEADAEPSDATAPSSPSTPSRRRSSASRGTSKERRPTSNPSPAKAMFQEIKSE